MKIVAALIGAIAAPILMVLAMFVLYRPARESWNIGVGMLMLLGGALLVPVGAIAGYRVGAALQAGSSETAFRTAVVAALLAALPAIFVVAVPYLPEPGPRRANARARVKWAKSRSAPNASDGRGLASSLEQCLRGARRAVTVDELLRSDGNCKRLRQTWYGAGPDAVAAEYGYLVGDEGWRWELGRDGESAIVFPDPLFEVAGPIFEAKPWLVVRRATRESPAYATDRYLADVETSRACLSKYAATLRSNGEWDGDSATLVALLARPEAVLAGCPTVSIARREPRRDGAITLNISGAVAYTHFDVHHYAVAAGFEWRFRTSGWAYFIESSGKWHTQQGTWATTDDPSPAPCLLDLTVPCT